MAKGFGNNKDTKTIHNKNSQFYFFLKEALQTSYKNIKNPEKVYKFLVPNLEIINNEFLDWYSVWLSNQLSQLSFKEALVLSRKISLFSGIIYQFPLGNKEINLEIAVIGREIAADFIKSINKFAWAEMQANLSVVYVDRIRGDKAENLEKAILACNKALKVINKENEPYLWGELNNNLGRAYCYRINGNKADNLEKAISHFKSALPVHTRLEFPIYWAKLQVNLGDAYLNRIEGNRAENLDIALNYLTSALEVYKKDNYPILWANSLNTLGAILYRIIRGDNAENLETAIGYFIAALQVYKYEVYPYDWAKVNLNLANAYRDRIVGNAVENKITSIQIDHAALQICTKETFPLEWARIQNNLGIAYIYLSSSKISKYQKQAIASFESALQSYHKEISLLDWAMAQKNLGIVYTQRINGDASENLDKAMQAYKAAFQVFTRDSFPSYWAKNHSNIAMAYSRLENLDEAIVSYQLALEVFTNKDFPFECLTSGRNLGEISRKAKLWLKAIEGYSAAIEAVETSRSWVKSESRRQEILEESIDIYQNIVQAYINAGQIDKAFEYSERSRSKRLVDLMASNNLSQSANIPPKVQELLQQYEELQQLIDAERQQYKSENNRSETRAAWQAYNEKIASLEADKQQVWENLRREDPVLAGEIQVNPLSLSEIQQLIDNPNTAIISFYTTNTDTHIFIVRQNQISLHTCTGEGLKTFQNWIYQNWLLDYVNDSKKWESQLETILREISQRLQLSEIIDQHLQGIEELIIEPHLLLHQIPFAALPTGEYQEHLVDRFMIRYTPSCQILEFCHQRPNVDIKSLEYGTVEDATDDLYCARWEGEQIAKMYNIPAEKRLIGSSQATRKNYRQLAEQVQIIHSCHHAESCLYNPFESQLKLADGNITLGQLMSPGWRLPNLVDVFLSCCETNLGTTPLTDDILTLSTGFLCAGAISVVSSLWSVDDLATALFSIFYYQQRQLSR